MTRETRSFHWGRLAVCGLLLTAYCALLSGCQALGYIASSAPQTVAARYKGLKGQTVGVMVWADAGLRMDWGSRLQSDLALSVQNKLSTSKAEEIKETTFPVDPRSIVRYQQDYPHVEATDILKVAPKLGVSRLIYIEIEQFTTRSSQAVDLLRGEASATVKVIEVGADKTAKVGYVENSIRVVFPPKSTPEGIPGSDMYPFYLGTVDQLATAVANRFIKHEEEK